MQFIKLVIVTLVLFINLAAAKNFTKGADYTEVTQELNHLLPLQNTPEQAGYTPEQFQQRLLQLQSQKTIIETANKRAQCRNETGKILAVYANKGKKYPTQLYYLATGQITDDDWDCDDDDLIFWLR